MHSKKIASLWIASTYPLPKSFPKEEIGLMTVGEFLSFRNPENKHHDAELWNYNLQTMNNPLFTVGNTFYKGKDFSFQTTAAREGYLIQQEDDPIGVIYKGTLYYKHGLSMEDVPTWFKKGTELERIFIRSMKPVKYLSEYISLISPVAQKNRSEHPIVIQHIRARGEELEIRTTSNQPGETIVILNTKGEIVAKATDEWGATLLAVVKEYRGKGLGRILGEAWYEKNPSNVSGGYSSSGEANAIRMWEDRVRSFLDKGWYTQLIQEDRITAKRVKEILSGVTGKRPESPLHYEKPPEKPPKPQILVLITDNSFVIYDSRFITDPDDKYILGHGLFESAYVGTYLFSIDYERPYHKLTTSVAFQIARDNKEKLYIGSGYGDLLELEGMPNIEYEGQYAFLTKDILPLGDIIRLEKLIRKKQDPHNEIRDTLIEMAESKWN